MGENSVPLCHRSLPAVGWFVVPLIYSALHFWQASWFPRLLSSGYQLVLANGRPCWETGGQEEGKSLFLCLMWSLEVDKCPLWLLVSAEQAHNKDSSFCHVPGFWDPGTPAPQPVHQGQGWLPLLLTSELPPSSQCYQCSAHT